MIELQQTILFPYYQTFVVAFLCHFIQEYVFLCCCHSKQIYVVCRVKSQHQIYEIWKYKADKNAPLWQEIDTIKHWFTKLYKRVDLDIFEVESTKTFKIVSWLNHVISLYKLMMAKARCNLLLMKIQNILDLGPNWTYQSTIKKKMAPNWAALVWSPLSLMGGSCRAYDVRLCCL